MPQRYLAFDIETARDIPGEDFNWREHRPLGISCAATLASGSTEPRHWYGKESDGSPAGRMRREDALQLIQYLGQMAAEGYKVLTWNGLGFDFDVLAEESGAAALCQACAIDHVDMMFQVVCTLGYPISLDKAAQGMGTPGKSPGMSGALAPRLWAQGRHQEVLEYVTQDVRTALQLAQLGEQRGALAWITGKGTRRQMPLTGGWLTVREALQLPEPDTAWMSSPILRRSFTTWLADAV